MANAESKTLTIERTFNAPLEKVWQAWTDEKQVQKWWGPYGVTNPTCEWDAKVGGKIHIVMLAGEELGELAGQRWPMQGVFKEVEASKRLVFSNQAIDNDGNILIDGLTTVDFEAEGGQTKVTITVVAKPVSPVAEQMIAGMDMGWNQQTDKLAAFVEEEV